MPSHLPSSFASAAAGQNANARNAGRPDGRGGGDLSRRDGRSANGTLTFRRSSTTPLGQAPQSAVPSDTSAQTLAADQLATAPQATFDLGGPAWYQKDDLLAMLKNTRGPGGEADISRLFISGWNPGHVNGNSARGWGRGNENHATQDSDACWTLEGGSRPTSMDSMSADEKEMFATDVNSSVKPPLHNKDGSHTGGPNGRKTSFSHSSANSYGLASPSSASRPGTRRRETTDANPLGSGALTSPTATMRFSRDDPPHWIGRKSIDVKESDVEEPEEEPGMNPRETAPGNRAPFGGLTRSNTAGTTGTSSLWNASTSTASSAAGGFGNFSLPSSTIGDKKFSGRGESRLAHLMPKEGPESAGGKGNEGLNPDINRPWRFRPRTDTDPFGEDTLSGSAALGGDPSAPLSQQAGRMGPFETPLKGNTGDFGMSGLNLGSQVEQDTVPLSPSETNPYRSPPVERGDGEENDESGLGKTHGTGSVSEQAPNLSTLSRGFAGNAFEGSDRSQTSSAGPKGYPSLPSLSGWPAPGPSTGTPDRDRPNFAGAFGSSLFSPMGDVQSPGLSGISGVFGSSGGAAIGSAGNMRSSSKLGSLFPASMQAQMQAQEHDSMSDSFGDLRQPNPLGAISRGVFAQGREAENALRAGRGGFEDMYPGPEGSRSHSMFQTTEPSHQATSQSQPFASTTATTANFGGQNAADPPTSQVRTMVLPDRMRWVYLDPQGNMQGPFTGLEMNDWYKANFFTPDLRVKKVEDPEFEPLGQLIRRIGNSREPFLVPQVGIPHGPPPQTGQFPPSNSSGIVPPLSSVFPSFGRTLTAEEQNNLERRKQEEQQGMARQREYIMRQQGLGKYPIPGPAGSLHHHSSAHSLQSQPSFGSMTSPLNIQQQAPIGAIPQASGFFDQQPMPTAVPASGIIPGPELFREDDLANLSPSERQTLLNLHGVSGIATVFPTQLMGASSTETSLRNQLPGTEQLPQDGLGFRERLLQFEQLRAEHDKEEALKEAAATHEGRFEAEDQLTRSPERAVTHRQVSKESAVSEISERRSSEQSDLSLLQKVQKNQVTTITTTTTNATGLPMPFPPPPPQSGTPLPAPTAQRARSNLPEQYNRSQSETPETVFPTTTQPPPLAPWARDPGSESQRGPSLKEIQEAEARKAAKAEEAAAAIRRAQLEQEAAIIREREKAAASGLAISSTWGNGSPVSALSPWAKPGLAKGIAPGMAGPAAPQEGKRKTLADIQREEEARKQRQKEIVQQASVASGAGKRYADLASKPNANVPQQAVPLNSGGGWAMVGAGGKVKVPTGPAAQMRAVSAGAARPAPQAKPVAKPATIGSSAGKVAAASEAQQEFRGWLTRELKRGLNDNVNVDQFASSLMELPLESQLIAEAVYGCSKTMNGNHFAEEYIRRKKLADKGVVERQPTSSSSSAAATPGEGKAAGGGGWSEVAKKGGHKEQQQADAGIPGVGYKMVSGRKKKAGK